MCYTIETSFPQKQIFPQTLDTKMIQLEPICLIPFSFRKNKISEFLNMQDKNNKFSSQLYIYLKKKKKKKEDRVINVGWGPFLIGSRDLDSEF